MLRQDRMIIDSHCHCGKGDGLTGPWDTDAPLDDYLRRATAAGITHTVLFSAFHSDYRAANRQVARIVKSHPRRFVGYAFIHAERDRGRVAAMVKEAVEGYGFRGIKVHRYDARITREICEVARAYHLPVLYDVVGEVSGVELIATQYPDVKFIIPHLGSFGDDWRAQLALIDPLVRHPNVYTDTSGIRRFDLLLQAGSDGPWLHPGVELAKVRALKLPATDEGLVLSGNLLRLLGDTPTLPDGRSTFATRGAPAPQHIRDPWEAVSSSEAPRL
jgi:predicted TIM-barrel fold metal-dependent hydrolase